MSLCKELICDSCEQQQPELYGGCNQRESFSWDCPFINSAVSGSATAIEDVHRLIRVINRGVEQTTDLTPAKRKRQIIWAGICPKQP